MTPQAFQAQAHENEVGAFRAIETPNDDAD
jgi:hypothetical protein